jgi:membrane-associated protease RseP (regulator of RpoE activity)
VFKPFPALLAAALLTSAASVAAKPAPAAPNPEALRAWHGRELRVAAITQRILAANAAACPKQSRQYGLVVARLDDASSPQVRAALTSALGLQDAPTALAVVPGSAAALAGLREGDRITAIGGTRWPEEQPAPPGARKAFWDALQAGQQAATMQVDAERDGQALTVTLTGKLACTASVFLIEHKSVNATTFGSRIEVHSALEALLDDEAELAFIISHELAHVILEHTGPGKEAQVKDHAVRQRIEVEADTLGVLLMARAGYEPAAAALANAHMARTNGPLTRLLGLHGSYMSTAERNAFLTRRAAEVRAQLALEADKR